MGHQVEFTDTRQILDVDDVQLSVAPIDRRNVTKPGDNDPVYIWSKFLVGRVSFVGINIPANPTQLLPRLKTGNTVGIKIRLANGRIYSGNIGIDGEGEGAKGTNAALKLSVEGTFTGELIEANAKALTARALGTRLDLHEGSSYTMAFQDIRGESAIRPFYKDGLTDNNTMIPAGIAAVVTAENADTRLVTHPYSGPEPLPIISASAQRFDNTSIFGVLRYAHGPRSCIPAAPSVTIGSEEVRRRITVAADPSEGNEVCAASGITFVRTVKVRETVLIIRVPCWWNGPEMPVQPAFKNFANDADYSIFGHTFAARELIFNGIEYNPYQDREGIFYRGWIVFTYKKGGHKAGKLICTQMVPLPPEGGGTFGSVVINSGFQTFWRDPTATFTELSVICGNCYATVNPDGGSGGIE